MTKSVPSPSPVRPFGSGDTSPSVRPLPTGTDTRSGPSPSPSPDPKCDPCQNYLQRRRTALLPLIGQQVTKTGTKPANIVERIRANYHRRGHSPTVTIEIKPDTTELTKALQRLAKTKRPA